MDQIDVTILELLQENGRMQNADIARHLDMAPSGVLERIRKLEKKNIIESYTARVNPYKAGVRLLAFILIKSDERPGSCDTAKKIIDLPEVLEVHNVAGEDCYLVKVRVSDSVKLSDFIREKLGVIESITSTRTLIVMDTLKETTNLNISLPESDE